MKTPVLILATALLSGCVMGLPGISSGPEYTRQNAPRLFAALDRRPDGTKGVVRGTGVSYEIISTHANDTRLCRLVSFKEPNRFRIESYCKRKGGEWR